MSTVEENKSATTVQTKLIVLLKATGDAPRLKQSKVKVNTSCEFVEVVLHLSRVLKQKSVGIFVYLNGGFTPSYNEHVGRLARWYGSGGGGELVVHYCLQAAYG